MDGRRHKPNGRLPCYAMHTALNASNCYIWLLLPSHGTQWTFVVTFSPSFLPSASYLYFDPPAAASFHPVDRDITMLPKSCLAVAGWGLMPPWDLHGAFKEDTGTKGTP